MTTLASEKQLRRSGRYAVVMGNLWRHPKRAKCGRGAMGLFLDMLSWCADQSTDSIDKESLRRVFAGDPNAARQLKELVSAGFVEVVDDSYKLHDFTDYNRVSIARDVDATNLRCTRDEDAMKTRPENTQESPAPRARAVSRSQVTILKEEECAAPPAPPTRPVRERKPRKQNPDKDLFKRVVAEETEKLEKLPFTLGDKKLAEVLAKARKFADRESITLEASLRQIVSEGCLRQIQAGKDIQWGPLNWQPGGTVVPLKTRGMSPGNANFDDAEDFEVQMARLRQAVGS